MRTARLPLTTIVHQRLAARLRPGDRAIDATAGNGHDTLFLATQVGPSGRVHAFDIQPEAVENTRQRLRQAGQLSQVTLHRSGHERMEERLPADWLGRVSAVTFNLGYLPGGDHTRTTMPATTLAALDQALRLLRAGGQLSVLAYRGHPGGQAEAEAVAVWFREHAAQLETEVLDSPGPILYLGTVRAQRNGDPSPESGSK